MKFKFLNNWRNGEDVLNCGVCGHKFTCDHEFVEENDGIKLSCPHCSKCNFENGLCNNCNGYYICPRCNGMFSLTPINPNQKYE